MLDNVQCNGAELYLTDCNSNPPYVHNSNPPYVHNSNPPYVHNSNPPYVHNSNHAKDAGVRCRAIYLFIHRVGEQIMVVDTPLTSESISKKVKRRFTFKRDKKKSKSPQETIEELSSEQHSKEFRDAFNSSPSPYKMDGQNSENSSLASSSAIHLSIPSDLHHLNRSNPGSAENVSQCGTSATFF